MSQRAVRHLETTPAATVEPRVLQRALARWSVDMRRPIPLCGVAGLHENLSAVWMRPHRNDPFRRLIKLIQDSRGSHVDRPALAPRGTAATVHDVPLTIMNINPKDAGVDLLSYLRHGSDGPR